MRYVRLYVSFLKTCLIRELMFRANFLVRIGTHMLWLAVMLSFIEVIFAHVPRIGDWDRYRYLIFLGTFLTINGTVNGLFIGNCVELGELIRTGNLDFALLRPVNEQFILTCRRIDFALVPQVVLGVGVAWHGCAHSGVVLSLNRVVIYAFLVFAGVAMLYAMLVMLSSAGFWIVQHRELFELWFILMQFSNYPDDIYKRGVTGVSIASAITAVIPLLLAINIPAKYAAMLLSGWAPVACFLTACTATLLASRLLFGFALKRYRGAGN